MKTQEAFTRLAYLHTLRYWKGRLFYLLTSKISIHLPTKAPHPPNSRAIETNHLTHRSHRDHTEQSEGTPKEEKIYGGFF
jgi:hypothetical protein